MKKSIFLTVLVLFVALVFAGCGTDTVKDMTSDVTSAINSAADRAESSLVGSEDRMSTESGNTITKDEAKRIALEHAQVKENDAYDIDINLDRDDGVLHYDVDFLTSSAEYDYDIHAESGKIISSSKEDKQ